MNIISQAFSVRFMATVTFVLDVRHHVLVSSHCEQNRLKICR